MITVRSILKEKGEEIYSVNQDSPIRDAIRLMAEKNIGAVMAMDENDQLVGIFSERDYAQLNSKKRSNDRTPVKEVMSTKIYFVSPKETAELCMALMTDRHIRHLPVVENGILIGVISIGDVVRSVINDQTSTIDSLENYIMGRGYGR